MSKQKKLLIAIILLIVVLMGIGYAALTAQTLTINGTAKLKANEDNFKVYFTGANTDKSANTEVTVTAQSQEATVTFSELDTKGETEYAILEIENASTDVSAESVEVTLSDGSNTNVLKSEAIMCDQTGATITDTSLASGAKAYVKVSVELLKTPTTTADTTITATITATPAENV